MTRALASLTVYAQFEPAKAKAMVLAAYKKTACHMRKTAEELKIGHVHLRKVVEVLQLQRELDVIAARFRAAGKHHFQVRDYTDVDRKRIATMKRNGTKRGRPAKQ